MLSHKRRNEGVFIMTDIEKFCCCCGARMPSNLTSYELVQQGCGITLGDGQILVFCGWGKHSNEDIRNAAKFVPGFHRASEVGK